MSTTRSRPKGRKSPSGATPATARPKNLPFIKVVSLAQDDADGTWHSRIIFDNLDGKRTALILSRSMMDKPGSMLNELSAHGYPTPTDKQDRAALKQYLIDARPAKRQRLVRATGRIGNAYVFPEMIVGDPKG